MESKFKKFVRILETKVYPYWRWIFLALIVAVLVIWFTHSKPKRPVPRPAPDAIKSVPGAQEKVLQTSWDSLHAVPHP